jgi:hypothetical protein
MLSKFTKYLDLSGYFEDEDTITIYVYMNGGPVRVWENIMTDIQIDHSWLTFEVNDASEESYNTGVYVPADKVSYFEIRTRKNSEAAERRETQRKVRMVDEYWDSELIGRTTPDMTYEEKYQALFGEDDATA